MDILIIFNKFRTIKHYNLGFLNENKTDKLRIQIYQATTNNQFNLIFKKDLPLNSIVSREKFIISTNRSISAIATNETDSASEFGQYSSFGQGNSLNDMMTISSSSSTSKNRLNDRKKQLASNFNWIFSFIFKDNFNFDFWLIAIDNQVNTVESVNYLVIIIGLVCLVFIFLPTVGTLESNIPAYMHMTFEMKLFAAFVLGMVTMVILKWNNNNHFIFLRTTSS